MATKPVYVMILALLLQGLSGCRDEPANGDPPDPPDPPAPQSQPTAAPAQLVASAGPVKTEAREAAAAPGVHIQGAFYLGPAATDPINIRQEPELLSLGLGGACLLVDLQPPGRAGSCERDSECLVTADQKAVGWHGYCAMAAGDARKQCWTRPGSSDDFCRKFRTAAPPPVAQAVPEHPVRIPPGASGKRWIVQACLNGLGTGSGGPPCAQEQATDRRKANGPATRLP